MAYKHQLMWGYVYGRPFFAWCDNRVNEHTPILAYTDTDIAPVYVDFPDTDTREVQIINGTWFVAVSNIDVYDDVFGFFGSLKDHTLTNTKRVTLNLQDMSIKDGWD